MTISKKTFKLPRPVLEGIFAFPPNRETLGATSYLILEKSGNILVDCPATDEINLQFLQDKGGISWLFLTHRGGIGKKIDRIQAEFDCKILIQEQESYLIPNVNTSTFTESFDINENCYCFWSPGHSPGSACLYWDVLGGVLFTGRHLLPKSPDVISPLRVAKTFHWPRQLQSVSAISDRFSADTLEYVCPGANTGFLRGKGYVDRAYFRLSQLDLGALETTPLSQF